MKKERFTLPFVPQLLCIYYSKQTFDYQLLIEVWRIFMERNRMGKSIPALLQKGLEKPPIMSMCICRRHNGYRSR